LEFARYTLIGGFATVGHYAILIALVEALRVPPSIAAASGAVCGALIAYAGNRRFTFPGNHRHRKALPRFLLVAALGAALNGGIVWAGTTILAWHYLAAQVAATLLALVITYSYNRSWTFA